MSHVIPSVSFSLILSFLFTCTPFRSPLLFLFLSAFLSLTLPFLFKCSPFRSLLLSLFVSASLSLTLSFLFFRLSFLYFSQLPFLFHYPSYLPVRLFLRLFLVSTLSLPFFYIILPIYQSAFSFASPSSLALSPPSIRPRGSQFVSSSRTRSSASGEGVCIKPFVPFLSHERLLHLPSIHFVAELD